MNKKKKRFQFQHAKNRFLDRHGFVLTKSVHQEMVNLIRSGKTEKVDVQSNRVVKHRIIYKNEVFFCIYDKSRHQIITVLPKIIENSE